MTVAQAPKRASPVQVAKAVFWSFLGIRKRHAYDADSVQITPRQVIVAGIVGAAVLVLSLIVLVRVVISRLA